MRLSGPSSTQKNRLRDTVKCFFSVFILCLFLPSVLLSGCSSSSPFIPVEERQQPVDVIGGSYTVRPGDTLYSIAWRYGMDFRRLAAANMIGAPFGIQAGQKLRLEERDPPTRSVRSSAARKSVSGRNRVLRKSTKAKAVAPASAEIRWKWPTSGTLFRKFSSRGSINKGIDIKGKLRESVNAAASGKVVYAGTGIRGYGKLIIVKHSERYLSAYAHNHRIHVDEEQMVEAGGKIAEMGKDGSGRALLHFEIRRNGKPVDPLKYLPVKGPEK